MCVVVELRLVGKAFLVLRVKLRPHSLQVVLIKLNSFLFAQAIKFDLIELLVSLFSILLNQLTIVHIPLQVVFVFVYRI